MASQKLINNKSENRLELHVEDTIAFVDYAIIQDVIKFTHTEVPMALSGKGIGSTLAQGVLDYAAKHQLKVKPFCPFIKAYIDRHSEYQANSLFHN